MQKKLSLKSQIQDANFIIKKNLKNLPSSSRPTTIEF